MEITYDNRFNIFRIKHPKFKEVEFTIELDNKDTIIITEEGDVLREFYSSTFFSIMLYINDIIEKADSINSGTLNPVSETFNKIKK